MAGAVRLCITVSPTGKPNIFHSRASSITAKMHSLFCSNSKRVVKLACMRQMAVVLSVMIMI